MPLLEGTCAQQNAVEPPIHIKNPWRACCEMLCHYSEFQLACCAHRIGLLFDDVWCILSPQMTPNRKPWRPTVNKRQVVSALVIGYVHSSSKPSVPTSNFRPQPTRGWWVDWYFSQFPITALTNTLEIVGSTCLTKYNICLMPGWQLQWWMDLIWLKSCLLGDPTHAQYEGSAVFLMRSTNWCGTLIRSSTWLCSNLTRTASTDSSYSLTKLVSTSSHYLISISLAALVCTPAFPVRVFVIHLCSQVVSMTMQSSCFPHQCHVHTF